MNWVLVTTASSLPIAEMWRDMLVSEGVAAIIRPGDSMASYLGVTSYPCRIMVADYQLDWARELMGEGYDGEGTLFEV